MQGSKPPAPVPLSWQPVPGAANLSFYPLVRKIDMVSSNTYLFQGDDILFMVDPGGLPEQAAQMIAAIQEARDIRDRPVVIFITHAHIDHFLNLQHTPAVNYFGDAVVAVQAAGADVIERGDRYLTQADILGLNVSPMKVGLRLLAGTGTQDFGTPAVCTLPDGTNFTITKSRDGSSTGLACEKIRFGAGSEIDVYHTPGHSPDSICMRIGRLLLVGDILFAANPGVAGLKGWNQAALVSSLENVRNIIASGTIDWVLPGHGKIIPAADAVPVFDNILADADRLVDIAELNAERAARTAEFAADCMEQINELFTIMAGRLYYVSYVMDELGESAMAEDMTSFIHGDTIDELLDAFREFSAEHHAGNRHSIFLALKAAQVLSKLGRSFQKDELARIIDPSIISRAERLIYDYTAILRGFSPPGEISASDIDSLLEDLVRTNSAHACTDEELLSSADDDHAFMDLLLSRIGMRPLLEDVSLSLSTACSGRRAYIDRDLFSDLVVYILEDLVGTGSDRITVQSCIHGETASVTIIGNTGIPSTQDRSATQAFLVRIAERAGGSLSRDTVGGMRRFIFIVRIENPAQS